MENIISVDLEEWYHFGLADESVMQKRKAQSHSRVVDATLKLLGILGAFNVKATFFVLGCIANDFPDLIKEIENNGHEIASHGYSHIPVFKLSQEEFNVDLKKSLETLSKVSKQNIRGYRAPYFSITEDSWIFDTLSKNGLTYDSSLKSKKTSAFYKILTSDGNIILEFPISCIRILNWKIPFSGGTYFRMLPKYFLKLIMEGLNRNGRLVNLYLHPRDIDVSLPRLRLSYLRQIRYAGHLADTEEKIRGLLGEFRFISIREFLAKNANKLSQ